MWDIMVSSLYAQSKMEGTLLTKEQVDEISTRISNELSERVIQQLEEAISTASSDNVG